MPSAPLTSHLLDCAAESGAEATRERAGGVLDTAREKLAGAAHAVGDTVLARRAAGLL